MKYRNTKYLPLLLPIIVLVIYSNTFYSPFVLDDNLNILNNPILLDFGYFYNPERIFDSSVINCIRNFFFNRFIGYYSFAVNYSISGFSTLGYHTTNILIHLINVMLVFQIIKITLSKTSYFKEIGISVETIDIISFSIAFLFAAHPIQTSAVTYIVQRFTSLATMFHLLAIIFYLMWRTGHSDLKKPFLYLISLIMMIFAKRTKEITFTLPLIILLYDIVFIKDKFLNRLLYTTPFLLCMLIIPLTLIAMASSSSGIYVSNHTNITSWHYFLTQLTVIIKYISLLFLPISQSLIYDYPLYTAINTEVFLSFMTLVGLFVLGVYLAYKSRQDIFDGLIGFGILWFFITLSVESSFIPISDYIFEHRLYLPSVGFFIAIVILTYKLVYKLNVNRKLWLFAVCTIFIALCLLTYMRNNVWIDEESLWQDNISKHPKNGRAYVNMMNYYKKTSQDEKFLEIAKKGLHNCPDDKYIKFILASFYSERNQFDRAEEILFSLKQISNTDARIDYELAHLFLKKQDVQKAKELFISSLKNGGFDPDTFYQLGRVYYDQGNYDKALHFFQLVLLNKSNHTDAMVMMVITHLKNDEEMKALNLLKIYATMNPNIEDDLVFKGVSLISKGQNKEAIQYLSLIEEILPHSSELHYFKGLAWFLLKDFDNAKYSFKVAIDLNTSYSAEAHFFLAKIYQKQGDKKNAIKQIKKSLEAKPDYELAQKTLGDLEGI